MDNFGCCTIPSSSPAPVRLTIEARRGLLIEENRLYRRWGDGPHNMDATRRRQTSNLVLSSWPERRPSSSQSDCDISTQNPQSGLVASIDHDGSPQRTARSITNSRARAMIVDSRQQMTMALGADTSPDKLIMAASTKGWSLDFLISKAPNTFRHADRVSAKLPLADLNARIKQYERSGRPLVIEGFHELDGWPKDELNLDRFVARAEKDTVVVRNVHTWKDDEVKLTDFVEKARSMSPYVQENETERWYGKDMDCPHAWQKWLRTGNVVPAALLGNGPHDLFRYRPESVPVQTLMCYLGIGDTFTPCHKDLCASSGQNLMCYTEHNGSSFWFMTESSVAPKASKYFQQLRHELDHENHVVTIEELAKAPFEVFILQQKLGDLVLVPPRSCHQVVNSGGITVKTSWSRMTLKGLITAYYHEIPIYRRVCRPEIYKVKSTIFHVMIGRTRELENLRRKGATSSTSLPRRMARISSNSNRESSVESLASSLKELISVADSILNEEYDKMGESMPSAFKGTDRFSEESSLTCDFCGGDIFQSFFECGSCVEGGLSRGDCLHICPGCYVDGRTCKCSRLQPRQYGSFQDLVDVRNKAVEAVHSYEKLQGRVFIAELKLSKESAPQLFRAACLLYSERIKPDNQKKRERICTSRDRHVMPLDAGLSCKGCHHSKCFRHILESHKVHAVDALLHHATDKTHQKYHANHIAKSSKFRDGLLALELDQMQGTRHSGYSQLVYNALNYSHFDPVRHKEFLSCGWYDNYEFIDDDDDDVHTPAPDESNVAVKNDPPLKIKISASKSNSLLLAPNSHLTKSSVQTSSLKARVNSRNIPLNRDSPDSDDIPLAPASTSSHVGDSDSADIELVDAEIRIEANGTSNSGGSEPAIEPRKRMIPYVLVPRLKYRIKLKDETIKGEQSVATPPMSPPYPTRMDNRELHPRPQSQPQSPLRKTGSGRATRSSKTVSSETEVPDSETESAMEPSSTQAIPVSTHAEIHPSSSSTVSTSSTLNPPSTASKGNRSRLPGTRIVGKSGLVIHIRPSNKTSIDEQPPQVANAIRKRRGSLPVSGSDAPNAKSDTDVFKSIRMNKKQKIGDDKVDATEGDVTQDGQTVTNRTLPPSLFFDTGVQASSTNLYPASSHNIDNTSSNSSNNDTPSSSAPSSGSVSTSSTEHSNHPLQQQQAGLIDHSQFSYDKMAGAMFTAMGNLLHFAANSVGSLPISATPSTFQTPLSPQNGYPHPHSMQLPRGQQPTFRSAGHYPPRRSFPSRGFSGQYDGPIFYGGRQGYYPDDRRHFYNHNRNPSFQSRRGRMHPYFNYNRNNSVYRNVYGQERFDCRHLDSRSGSAHSPTHEPEPERSPGTKTRLQRQMYPQYVDDQSTAPTRSASGSGQASSQHIDSRQRPFHRSHAHVEYEPRRHRHQEEEQSRSGSSPSRRSSRKSASQQPVASTSRLRDSYEKHGEERHRDSLQPPFKSRSFDESDRNSSPGEWVSRNARSRYHDTSCDDSPFPTTPEDEGGIDESTSRSQEQRLSLLERMSSPRLHQPDKQRSARHRSSRNSTREEKGKGKVKGKEREKEMSSVPSSPTMCKELHLAADQRHSPSSWTSQAEESIRSDVHGASYSSRITAPHLEPTHSPSHSLSPSTSSESESTLQTRTRQRPSRFGPLLSGNEGQGEEDNWPSEVQGSPTTDKYTRQEEEEDLPAPPTPPTSSRPPEVRSGIFVYVDPRPTGNEKTKGKRRADPSCTMTDVDNTASATLDDEESGHALPESEPSGSVARAQASRAAGGAGSGGGGHHMEEQEETVEEEEEKVNELKNSRRQEEEEAAPIREEEEEEEEAQNWEDNYAMEDEEVVPQPAHRSLTPRVRDDDEVSLGEHDDCGGPLNFSTGQ